MPKICFFIAAMRTNTLLRTLQFICICLVVLSNQVFANKSCVDQLLNFSEARVNAMDEMRAGKVSERILKRMDELMKTTKITIEHP